MDDAEIVGLIDSLVGEEHKLERDHADGGLSSEAQERLKNIEIQLDRCWDLLRQRRARRAAGKDPNEAEMRSADVVEDYQQ